LLDFIKVALEGYGGLGKEIVHQGEVKLGRECGDYGPVTYVLIHVIAFFLTLVMMDSY